MAGISSQQCGSIRYKKQETGRIRIQISPPFRTDILSFIPPIPLYELTFSSSHTFGCMCVCVCAFFRLFRQSYSLLFCVFTFVSPQHWLTWKLAGWLAGCRSRICRYRRPPIWGCQSVEQRGARMGRQSYVF